MPSDWNPQVYLAFADERRRPAAELLARVAASSPEEICDLGCGTGAATRLLHERWPTARLTGIDDSPAMLRAARRDWPEIHWQEADIATWRPTRAPDVIFSNAALNWLPDHPTLLPRLLGFLRAGGTLAVQMPRNYAAPSHRAIADVVAAGPWREQLAPLVREAPVSPPRAYYGISAPHCRTLEIWETGYLHVLEGDDPVLAWLRGTALRPFLDALDGTERTEFEWRAGERLRTAYPPEADGRTLFTMRRLFIVATR